VSFVPETTRDRTTVTRVISETFNFKKYRDLDIPVKDQSRSLKVVPFDRLCMVSYSVL